MDTKTIIYIVLVIVFSLISSQNKKKKKQEAENTGNDKGSLEEEIRRMLQRTEEKRTADPTPAPQPEYKPQPTHTPTYRDLENEEPLEKLPKREYTDLSQRDIEKVENEYARFNTYTPVNYEAQVTESIEKGKETHTVMDYSVSAVSIQEHIIHRSKFLDDFDARKAIIYSEILKRPEW